jgi:histidinol dehydrogenase
MKLFTEPDPSTWHTLCARPQLELEFLESTVRNILLRVKQGGDAALKAFNLQFDGAETHNLQVPREAIEQAESQLPPTLAEAIRLAYANIEKFHHSQLAQVSKVETQPGVTCWRRAVPLQRVGIYIPGGTAPLFSTVLMLAIPARIAGCREIVLCTPPAKDGSVHPAILFAAGLAGVQRVCKAGGAQAIAAMAYGTQTVPAVDKIFGPGNQYVTKAKEMVAREGVAIDLPAGPSEVLVWADEHAHPAFVAADLLSQAEHGADSQVILVCNTPEVAERIMAQVKQQLETLPRKNIAEKALDHSRAIVFSQTDQALAFINTYAPEHLIINTQNAAALAHHITNAGSVFLGNYTPEAAGDYASGTNHTLPTNGYARLYGGVSVESFMKYITFQEITPAGLRALGPAVAEMARAEQLEGHARAVTIRLNELP